MFVVSSTLACHDMGFCVRSAGLKSGWNAVSALGFGAGVNMILSSLASAMSLTLLVCDGSLSAGVNMMLSSLASAMSLALASKVDAMVCDAVEVMISA